MIHVQAWSLRRSELLWSPYAIEQTIIFSSCGFFLLLSFCFSWLNLSRRRLAVCHTSTHDVALVRIWNAGLKYAARGSLEMQDAKNRQKIAVWAPSRNLSGYILATKARIDNRRKTC